MSCVGDQTSVAPAARMSWGLAPKIALRCTKNPDRPSPPHSARVWLQVSEPRAHRMPGRHTHWRLARRRHFLLRAGTMAALLAVIGPGLLAGLSDDDPAGITTYSILGAKYGYELLWVLALSTAALIVFHELGVRLGIVTGKGLLTLV